MREVQGIKPCFIVKESMVFRPAFKLLKEASQEFYQEAENMPERFTVRWSGFDAYGGIEYKRQVFSRNKYRGNHYHPNIVLQKRGISKNFDGSIQEILLYNKPHTATCYGHITVLEKDWNEKGGFHITLNVVDNIQNEGADSNEQVLTCEPVRVSYRVIPKANGPWQCISDDDDPPHLDDATQVCCAEYKTAFIDYLSQEQILKHHIGGGLMHKAKAKSMFKKRWTTLKRPTINTMKFQTLTLDLRQFTIKSNALNEDLEFITMDAEDEIKKHRLCKTRFMMREHTMITVPRSTFKNRDITRIAYRMFCLDLYVFADIIVEARSWNDFGKFIVAISERKPHSRLLRSKKVPKNVPYFAGSDIYIFTFDADKRKLNSQTASTSQRSSWIKNKDRADGVAEHFRQYLIMLLDSKGAKKNT